MFTSNNVNIIFSILTIKYGYFISEPGEMVQETQYRPPTYASAWPAISHISMVGKGQYPFRKPESEQSETSLHAGRSIWDNNDYFIKKADISVENKSENKMDNYFENTMHVRRYSAGNGVPAEVHNTHEYRSDYRRSSLGGGADMLSDDLIQPFPRRNFYQNRVQNKINVGYPDNERGVYPTTDTERRLQSTAGMDRRSVDDDVVVEVRIPSRYFKPKTETMETRIETNTRSIPSNARKERHDYTHIISGDLADRQPVLPKQIKSQTSPKTESETKSKDV